MEIERSFEEEKKKNQTAPYGVRACSLLSPVPFVEPEHSAGGVAWKLLLRPCVKNRCAPKVSPPFFIFLHPAVADVRASPLRRSYHVPHILPIDLVYPRPAAFLLSPRLKEAMHERTVNDAAAFAV